MLTFKFEDTVFEEIESKLVYVKTQTQVLYCPMNEI